MGGLVGSYKLLERLGEGGMGEVFRVEHQNKLFAERQGARALKLMRAELQRDARFSRFCFAGSCPSSTPIALAILTAERTFAQCFFDRRLECL